MEETRKRKEGDQVVTPLAFPLTITLSFVMIPILNAL